MKSAVFSSAAGAGAHICRIDSAAAGAGPAVGRGVGARRGRTAGISAGGIGPVGIVAGGGIIAAAFIAENGIAKGFGGIHGGKGLPFAHDKSPDPDQVIDGSAHTDQADENAKNVHGQAAGKEADGVPDQRGDGIAQRLIFFHDSAGIVQHRFAVLKILHRSDDIQNTDYADHSRKPVKEEEEEDQRIQNLKRSDDDPEDAPDLHPLGQGVEQRLRVFRRLCLHPEGVVHRAAAVDTDHRFVHDLFAAMRTVFHNIFSFLLLC